MALSSSIFLAPNDGVQPREVGGEIILESFSALRRESVSVRGPVIITTAMATAR